MVSRPFGVAILLLAFSLAAPVAAAHMGHFGDGVETRWEMPPWILWSSGALVVALSFAVVGAFASRASRPARSTATVTPPLTRAFGPANVAALLVLGILVAAPFAGGAPELPGVLVWLVLWAALPMLAYLYANAWPRLDPFAVLAPLADRLRGGRAKRPYPERFGSWPAVLVLLALVGLEVAPASAWHEGTRLSILILAYVLLSFAGMVVFGSTVYRTRAEVFSRSMRFWAACSPRLVEDGRVRWGLPARGLARLRLDGYADVAFVVALLFGVSFDAFLATRWGSAAAAAVGNGVGPSLAHLILLAFGYASFLAAFTACAVAIRRVSESLESPSRLAAKLAASLLPIAVAYHFAHNAFYLVEQAPRIATTLLDPFAMGWASGLGLPASFAIPVSWAPAAALFQILVIMAGHVLAVIVAHDLALRAFPSRIQGIRSELPLTAVMVLYTFVGLWLLGQGAHGGPL